MLCLSTTTSITQDIGWEMRTWDTVYIVFRVVLDAELAMLQLLNCSAYQQVVPSRVALAYYVAVFKTSLFYLFILNSFPAQIPFSNQYPMKLVFAFCPLRMLNTLAHISFEKQPTSEMFLRFGEVFTSPEGLNIDYKSKPLLGWFAKGMLSPHQECDCWVPFVWHAA